MRELGGTGGFWGGVVSVATGPEGASWGAGNLRMDVVITGLGNTSLAGSSSPVLRNAPPPCRIAASLCRANGYPVITGKGIFKRQTR